MRNNTGASVPIKGSIRFTLGALWPMGAWGPRRDLMAKRTICLLTKMNSSTNTWKQTRHARHRCGYYAFNYASKLTVLLTRLP